MVPWGFYRLARFGIGPGLFLVVRLLILLAVVLVVWLVVRALRSGGQVGKSRPEDPLNVLKVRYVKGEITREEYERTREELKT